MKRLGFPHVALLGKYAVRSATRLSLQEQASDLRSRAGRNAPFAIGVSSNGIGRRVECPFHDVQVVPNDLNLTGQMDLRVKFLRERIVQSRAVSGIGAPVASINGAALASWRFV